MAKKRVFISFDYDNDLRYKNMLLAWNSHDDFDFEFYDGSLKEAINSSNATYIKSKIKPMIEKSSHILCIVGKESGSNTWINWEVQTGVDNRKKLVGVKLDRGYESPPALKNNNASWAMSYTFDSIKKALDSA
jgi:hypothetical protein